MRQPLIIAATIILLLGCSKEETPQSPQSQNYVHPYYGKIIKYVDWIEYTSTDRINWSYRNAEIDTNYISNDTMYLNYSKTSYHLFDKNVFDGGKIIFSKYQTDPNRYWHYDSQGRVSLIEGVPGVDREFTYNADGTFDMFMYNGNKYEFAGIPIEGDGKNTPKLCAWSGLTGFYLYLSIYVLQKGNPLTEIYGHEHIYTYDNKDYPITIDRIFVQPDIGDTTYIKRESVITYY